MHLCVRVGVCVKTQTGLYTVIHKHIVYMLHEPRAKSEREISHGFQEESAHMYVVL